MLKIILVMSDEQQKFCPEKFNVILVNINRNFLDDFDEASREYFKERRDQFINNFKIITNDGTYKHHYYKVLKYLIFGVYDIAFFVLSESDKFAQKLFLPITNQNNSSKIPQNGLNLNIVPPSSYQILTGITYPVHKNFDLNDCFSNLIMENNSNNDYNISKGKYKYVLICCLKMNPGHLLGGGMDYFHLVEITLNNLIQCKIHQKGKECLKSINTLNIEDIPNNQLSENSQYIITRSFSWNDLTLTVFSNDLLTLQDLVLDIRKLTFSYIMKIIKSDSPRFQTIYDLLCQNSKEKILNSHIFIETQSYIGVEYDTFLHEEIQDDNFITSVEYKLKSGHENIFIKKLKEDDDFFNKNFVQDSQRFIFGATDVLLKEKNDTIKSNFEITTKLWNQNINKHIIKVKTNVFTNLPNEDVPDDEYNIVDYRALVSKLLFAKLELKEIDLQLKALKIPRHLRQKSIKLFQSYNNGILDPVLTLSFQDFYFFLKDFKTQIKSQFDENIKVHKIEEIIDKNIRIFDKALQSRVLNTYLYEEMGDIDIDYQSSIQKLLSIFNAIVQNESFRYPSKNNYHFGKLVNSHLKNTVANINAINFNIHHLTSPEFIFISIEKELLNSIIDEKYIDELFNAITNKLSEKTKEKFLLNDLHKNETRELLKYIAIDIIRVKRTFGNRIDMYLYFSWFFNLQNASIYSTDGFLNSANFIYEIKRMLLTVFIFDNSKFDEFYLPTIELANEWYNEFYELKESIITEKEQISLIIDLPELNKLLEDKRGEYGTDFNYEIFQHLQKVDTLEIPERPGSIGNTYADLLNKNCSKSIYDLYYSIIYMNNNYHENIIESKIEINNYRLFYSTIYNFISHIYLKRIFKINNGKIGLLKRNLETGKPLQSFIDLEKEKPDDEKFLYLIDNQGGIFFINEDRLRDYYKLRDEYFKVLFDLNLKIKTLNFLDNYID